MVKYGGITLIESYGNSVAKLVMNVYPTYTWKPWLFHYSSKLESQSWNDKSKEVSHCFFFNSKDEFLQDFEKKHFISSPEDW